MKSTMGCARRALTDAQVQRVLTWHTRLQEWKDQRKQVCTLNAFARANGMNPTTLSRWVRTLDEKLEKLQKLERFRAWHEAIEDLKARRRRFETLKGLARELGVSEETIAEAIQRNGRYKAPSPEQRAQNLLDRRAHLARLRRQGFC